MANIRPVAGSYKRVPHVYSYDISQVGSKWFLKINKTFLFGPYESRLTAVSILQGMVTHNSGTRNVGLISTDYAIWGAAWAATDGMRAATANYPAIENMAWMVRSPTRFNPSSATTLSTAQMNQYVADISSVPATRRVVIPGFLLDGGLAGNDEVNDEFYKIVTNTQATTWDSSQFNTFWPVESTTAMTNCWTDFLARAEAAGQTFDHIADDQEQFQHFAPWNRAHIGPVESPDGYLVDPDARRIAALVNDARYATTAVDFGATKTFSQLVKDYANAIDNTSYAAKTDEEMLAYWVWNSAAHTTYRTATDFPSPYTTDWGSSEVPSKLVGNYAYLAALKETFARKRYQEIWVPALIEGWVTSYSNYDMFPVGTDQINQCRDYNSHKGYGGLIPPVFNPCFQMYGYVGSLGSANYGGKTSPPGTEATNPDDWYGWYTGAGVSVPSNYAHLAFILEVSKIRHALYGYWTHLTGSNPAHMAAWVTHPNTDYATAKFSIDPRYAYEAWCHAAVLGVNKFYWFQLNTESDTSKWEPALLQNFLDDMYTLTGNSVLVSCTNATSSSSAKTDRMIIGDSIANAAVSGGVIQTGTLAGQKLWRITVPPNLVNGSGATLVQFDNIAHDDVIIDSTERGCWVFSSTRPEVTVTAAP